MMTSNDLQPNKFASTLRSWLLGQKLPLMVRFGLFILFTILSIIGTLVLLPHLVVLGPLGYVAGFVINLVSSAAIIVPGPGLAGIVLMASQLDPVLLGIAAGVGGTLGELTGYWLGAQSRDHISENRVYSILAGIMGRAGGGLLFFFGLLPFLPVDLAGLLAGASNYSVSKFLVYVGLGKILMSVTILFLAAKAFAWAQPYLMWLGL